jgi:phosphatidate cytidylyltransferase
MTQAPSDQHEDVAVSEPVPRRVPFPKRELLLRLTSGIVLAAVTLAMTWWGPISFAILVGVIALILLWEWGHLTTGTGFTPARAIAGVAILAALGLTVSGRPDFGVLLVAAGGIVAAVSPGRGRRGMEMAGVLYAGVPAVSLLWLRSDVSYGLEGIVLLLLVVWATDTGAFVAGRSIGGPRLWARVSPNKTWSGLIGGVCAAALCAWLFVTWRGGVAGIGLVLLAAGLALVSQAGDLFESALKRAYGVKDASSLIPGHGGFMDRVDGLVFAAVAAAAFAAIVGAKQPAGALLGLG